MQVLSQERLYAELGARIRRAREARSPKVTQADLARRLDVERTSITNIEKGTQRVTLMLLYGIARELQVPLERLLPDLDDPSILAGTVSKLAEIRMGNERKTVPVAVKSVYDKI